MGAGLTLDGQQVRLVNLELGSVFYEDDSLSVVNQVRERIEERCLTASGAPTDQHRSAGLYLQPKVGSELFGKCSALNQIIHR